MYLSIDFWILQISSTQISYWFPLKPAVFSHSKSFSTISSWNFTFLCHKAECMQLADNLKHRYKQFYLLRLWRKAWNHKAAELQSPRTKRQILELENTTTTRFLVHGGISTSVHSPWNDKLRRNRTLVLTTLVLLGRNDLIPPAISPWQGGWN